MASGEGGRPKITYVAPPMAQHNATTPAAINRRLTMDASSMCEIRVFDQLPVTHGALEITWRRL
jgi:hypothetical protein